MSGKKFRFTTVCYFINLLLANGSAMDVDDLKVNPGRMLLAKLREGDYAHAGETEAIDMVLKQTRALDPTIETKPTLDVGSGFGGSAHYLYQKGFTSIQGIDIDQTAVAYSQRKYPMIPFQVADALEIDKYFSPNSFSILYLLNVFYAIEDKATLLRKLVEVANSEGILILFDYTSGRESSVPPFVDLANKPMYPIAVDSIETILNEAGWGLIDITDLTQNYIDWYKKLLEKLTLQAADLQGEFSAEIILQVQKTFTFLLDHLEGGQLGGAMITARKKPNS